uniref:Uncharacterized protein n=1 Tax=Percolomonas cosmopolitus TaxID=63605 RepID=A0A7S1PFZ9_9EUKA|mmetsp:Transcript_2336/g.8741  ORF Transcript_2336/g.8741 Transcript_2336/m.8741 type:complete len:267 (+) Transcript_2336:151-951(+)|eukprot:CAMPEP_0117444722 /NCGR_PEP_ID=MMETSP0759-20121206/5398_1 /TAXON_ID=63605 /ORGANISM="Percolomonas cosmopolitus, Strain WS" /LENGTH=266 /DNA_ID=CAMNT_0005236819 /DNA_START=132 /DNA_END=932 /DNA_ORIENTATION=-
MSATKSVLLLALVLALCSLTFAANRNFHYPSTTIAREEAASLDATSSDISLSTKGIDDAEMDKEEFLKLAKKELTLKQKDEMSKKAFQVIESAKQAHHFAIETERLVEEIAKIAGALGISADTQANAQTLAQSLGDDLQATLSGAADSADDAIHSAERASASIEKMQTYLPQDVNTHTLNAVSDDFVVATIFESCHFQGRQFQIKANQRKANFAGHIGSVRFELPIAKFTLFERQDFSGAKRTFTQQIDCVQNEAHSFSFVLPQQI